MVKPQHKRVKGPSSQSEEDEDKVDSSASNFPTYQLETIHGQLNKKCLCPLLLADIVRTLSDCNHCFSTQNVQSLGKLHCEILLYTSMLSLFFEVSLKQSSKGVVCTRVSQVVAAGADNEGAVVDILFGLLALEDKYVSYSAGRAISTLLLMLKGTACQFVFERLVRNVAHSSNLLEVGHSIDVIRRIIEWKDLDEHPLEGSESEIGHPSHCIKIILSPADTEGANEVKYIATKQLESKWFTLVTKLSNLIIDFSLDKEHVIVSFLTLWEALISVKANLSVVDTKEFYSGLERLLNLLNHQTPSIIWRKVLDLYNEVLCYGSTLALQDILAEEPCNLAHLIIRAVKDRQFLECVPWSGSALLGPENIVVNGSSAAFIPEFASSSSTSNSSAWTSNSDADENTSSMISSHCNKTLLHKIVLLVLKSIAVTVKETRCDSSSDNSSRSGGSGSEDVDMAIIERSLREVLKKLDIFVKGKFPFHPECSMSEWMVRLFADQDDWLIESMVCGLDIYMGLEVWMRHHSELEAWVNPHHTFGVFVETLHLDHDILLDLLVSNETCFLLYLLRYLKLVRRNWAFFGRQCPRLMQQIMTVLIRLRLAIDRLVSKNLFPYNINPVLKLLEKCEEIYESHPA